MTTNADVVRSKRPALLAAHDGTGASAPSQQREDNVIEELAKPIKRAAKAVAFQWPGVVEEEDVEQMIHERLLESRGSVVKILEMDDRAQYRAIVGIGHQLASQERADYSFYKGSYRYSVKEVKSVLAAGILVEEFDHWVDVVHDLMEALEALVKRTPQYVDAILSRYADWKQPESGNDKMTLSRSLTALTDEMNKSNKRRFMERDDGVGTRKVLSREQSRWASKEGWDADYMPAPTHMRNNHLEKEVWE